MGDYANYLVPERYRINAPEREDMERRMIGWMQKNGWLRPGKKGKHPQILGEEGGWIVTAKGSRHMHPPAYHQKSVDWDVRWMREQGELTGPADRPQLTPKGMLKVYGSGGPDAVSRPFSVESWREEQGAFGGVAVEVFEEGKGIFTSHGAGLDEVLCPKCGANIVEHFMEMVETWYTAEGYPPIPCPECGAASEIRDYKMDIPWGFSQIGFAFWNTVGDLSEDFVAEFAAELGEPVRRVYVKI